LSETFETFDDVFDVGDVEQGERKVGFAIDSLNKANWAIAKIAKAEANIATRKLVADKYIKKVIDWVESANKTDKSTVESMTGMLKPWAEVEIAKSGKAKHVKLMDGEIGYRQNPDRLEIEDEKAALAAVPENCKRVKVEIDKVAVKALIKEKGEVFEGCKIVAGDIAWYVKTDFASMVRLP
jgi:phage host-nuclease inhibitor protein Gam